MTEEQFGQLMAAVVECTESNKRLSVDVGKLRGEVMKTNGELRGIRGELVIMQATDKEHGDKLDKLGAKLDAVIQTVGGINSLAKSSYDMSASNTASIKKIKLVVGIQDDENESAVASPRNARG